MITASLVREELVNAVGNIYLREFTTPDVSGSASYLLDMGVNRGELIGAQVSASGSSNFDFHLLDKESDDLSAIGTVDEILRVTGVTTGVYDDQAINANWINNDPLLRTILMFNTTANSGTMMNIRIALTYAKHVDVYKYSRWTPSHEVARCVLDLRSDEGVTLLGSNKVMNWIDVSGNGNNAEQGYGPYQYSYVPNQVNGFPVLSSNADHPISGQGNFMNVRNIGPSLSGVNAEFTMFAVGDIKGSGSIFSLFAAVSTSSPALLAIGAFGSQYAFEKIDDTGASFTASGGSVSFGKPIIMEFLCPGQGIQIFENNVLQINNVFSLGQTTLNVAIITGFNTDNFDFLRLLIFNTALCASDRKRVRDYLTLLYGIS